MMLVPSAPPGIPTHVVLILDGNGRWATQRGLPRLEGHRATTRHFMQILETALDLELPVLTLYGFSTENWRRSPEEVSGLMEILLENINRLMGRLHSLGVRLHHLGSLEGLSPALRTAIAESVVLTQDNRRMVFNLAVNYGGRAEIVRAVRSLVAANTPIEHIDEHAISALLDTHGQPDPDLVIRTGGQMRLSNSPLWQVAYSEFYFTSTLGPDFTGEDLREAIASFRSRTRTYGREPDDILIRSEQVWNRWQSDTLHD